MVPNCEDPVEMLLKKLHQLKRDIQDYSDRQNMIRKFEKLSIINQEEKRFPNTSFKPKENK